ncbi:MAG: MFS transporter [Pseudomonadota bacterium]
MLEKTTSAPQDASPLKDRVFRPLFAAQVIALAGTGLTTVALALLAYDLAGSQAGAVLGTVLAIKMVAYVGVAPLAGAYAGRLPRRTFLVALDCVRAALIACLPFVTALWQVYALVFFLNAASACFTPVFQATIPEVLQDERRYTRALSLSRLAYDLESLLSPSLAAAALLLLSYDALFSLNAAAFLLSGLLILSVQLPVRQTSENAASPWALLREGFFVYFGTPRLRALFLLSFAAACGGATVIVNTVVYVQTTLGGGQVATALGYACYGAGSMAAALILPKMLDRYADRAFMLFGAALVAITLMLGSRLPDQMGFLVIWFVLGVATSLILTPSARLVQRSATEESRAALYASQFALSHLGWLASYLLAGWVGAQIGLSWAFVCLAVLAGVSALGAAVLWNGRHETAQEHVHPAQDHTHLHIHDDHHQHEHEGWEGPEPHSHPHYHAAKRHRHAYVIDLHHRSWP